MNVVYASFSGLSPAQDAELAILMGLCEGKDGASTCLEFDDSLNYDKSMPSYVLAREEGVKGRLLGAATLFAPMLVKFAAAHDTDLIVIGTHGRSGLLNLLMGSFIENLMRLTPCPLLIVRGQPHTTDA